MRVPPVNERVKEAPAHALRAMFAGIGQLLLVTDRFRSRTPENEAAQESGAQSTATAPSEAATTEQAPVSDQPTAEAATEPEAAAVPETAPVAEAGAEPGTAAASAATVAADATAEAPATTLPLANYDELTIPSLRARLRNLSADQLIQLIGYEKSHANRPEVISMFERRIVKLAEG